MIHRVSRVAALTAFATTLASGCLVAPGSGGPNEQQGGKVTLELPTWQLEDKGFGTWHKRLATAFEKQNPKIDIKLQSIPFDSFTDTMITRFSSGNPPDIVHLPARYVPQFASQGWLKPLDEQLQQTDIPKKWTPLQSSMQWKGKTYGLLLLGYGYVLYYNERLLKQAGVEVPQTPEELIKAAKAVTGDGTYGFGLTTAQHPDNYTEATQFVVGEGGSWTENGRFAATDAEVVQALDDLRTVAQYAPRGVQSKQRTELFMNGKIAMILDGPFLLPEFAKAPSDVRPHLKVALPPFAKVPGGASNSFHVPSGISEQKQDLVWEYLQLAASPKWQRRYAKLVQVPPPRQGVVTEEIRKQVPAFEVFERAAADAVDVFPERPDLKNNYAELEDTISGGVIRLFTSDKPTREVAETLQQKLNERFGQSD